LNAIPDRLIARAFIRIHRESSLGFFPGAGRDLEFVSQADPGDLENPVHLFNVPFYEGDEIVGSLDFPRFQRSPKGSGESPAHSGDHVIQGRRIFGTFDLTAVFLLVEILDTAVHAEMDGLREVLDVRGTVGAFMLHNTDVTGVGYGHG
jgi:hypothetical protein